MHEFKILITEILTPVLVYLDSKQFLQRFYFTWSFTTHLMMCQKLHSYLNYVFQAKRTYGKDTLILKIYRRYHNFFQFMEKPFMVFVLAFDSSVCALQIGILNFYQYPRFRG